MKSCPQCQTTYADSYDFCKKDGFALTLLELETLAAGMTIRNKWRILEEAGRGGMGVVYRAQHTLFKYERALKVINSKYTGDREFLQRFLAEAVMANQINSPYVVRVEDAEETDDGIPYLVMEYVQGVSLRRLLQPDSLTVRFRLRR